MRYTLSSLLSKLISVEEEFKNLYLKAIEEADDHHLKSFLNELASDVDKRIEEINWVKDFIVVEMTLEPIIGPDLIEYLDKAKAALSKGISLQRIKDVEEIRIEMYRRVIDMVSNISPETADIISEFIEKSKKALES